MGLVGCLTRIQEFVIYTSLMVNQLLKTQVMLSINDLLNISQKYTVIIQNGQKGPLLKGSRYFRVAVIFGQVKETFVIRNGLRQRGCVL